VDEEYDSGPILAQRVVPVLAYDSPSDLAARVLKQVCFLPNTYHWIHIADVVGAIWLQYANRKLWENSICMSVFGLDKNVVKLKENCNQYWGLDVRYQLPVGWAPGY
jgi:hypothetical protein